MEKKNLAALMSRITENANKLIVHELEKRGIQGIVPSHGSILGLLLDGQEYTMKDLADRIHRTKPTVTVLIDKLVRLGYVVKEKSQDDSRVTFIRLTDEGRALQPDFAAVSETLNAVIYRNLSEQEAKQLQDQLTLILHNFDDVPPVT